METHEASRGTGLFLVRLWRPAEVESLDLCRGRVIHITSGRACDFVQLHLLGLLLVQMLDEPRAGPPSPPQNVDTDMLASGWNRPGTSR